MPRLHRPHVPLEVRLRVALRQRGFSPGVVNEGVRAAKRGRRIGKALAAILKELARQRGCDVSDLRLDHDPPLAARPRFSRGLGKKTYYKPAANDPDHLFYRPHDPQFEGSHLIKTNQRGDHGQYPDRVLIKRERKRRRREELGIVAKKAGKLRVGKRRSWGSGRSTGSFIVNRPLTSCVRGAGCSCKNDPNKWRRRKVACGNWRTMKIGKKR
jgi:hypothetical protein